MLFELLRFLLSTNAKVKKMTTESAVMFEIVKMYIFQNSGMQAGSELQTTLII
jgi:hypothetical protein